MTRTGLDEPGRPDDDPERGPEPLAQWLTAGFSAEEAEVWRNWRFRIVTASSWRDAGVPSGLRAAQWATAGVSPATVGRWRAAGIGAPEAVTWHELGFGLEDARRHKANGIAAMPLLETFERGDKQEILDKLLHSASREFSMRDVIARTGWTQSAVMQTAIALTATDRARVINENPWAIASAACTAEFAAALLKHVDEFHRANPLAQGIPKQDLRAKAGNPSAALFEFALRDLRNAGAVALTGDFVHRANRGVELSAEESAAKLALQTRRPSRKIGEARADAPPRKGAHPRRARPRAPCQNLATSKTARCGVQEPARRSPVCRSIQRAYGRLAQVRRPVTGTPRPRARDKAGG